jgi:hypothetical protein
MPRLKLISQTESKQKIMYRYDQYDHQMLADRIAQFRDQTRRFLEGQLSDAEFLPLRLQNGLYVQRLAPMLRVAIPYGMLSSAQMRKLAFIADQFDKGYGHLTTRQNIQFNWPALADVPDILAHLAEVEMHAIQTSGNCIRNTTTDQFAGVAVDEVEDARAYCEIIRQWSTSRLQYVALAKTKPQHRYTISAYICSKTNTMRLVFVCWSVADWAEHQSSAAKLMRFYRKSTYSPTSMPFSGSTTGKAGGIINTKHV